MRVNINSVDTSAPTNEFKVGFLAIKPGERAIVRFLLDSDEDFDVVTLHNCTTAENKPIRIDCIRNPQDPVDKCPLCAAGADVAKLEQRVFLRLLEYVQNPDGTFTPKARIWDRSIRSDIITSLKTYLMDYGPLSDIICSISRTGTGLDTKYTVSPNLPGAERYPLDASAFNDFDVVGTIVRSWDPNQMVEFLTTGEIPAKPQQAPAPQAGFNPPPAVTNETIPFDTTPVAPQPAVTQSTTSVHTTPVQSMNDNYNAASSTTSRPRRVYN